MPFFRHNANAVARREALGAQKRLPARRVGGDFVRGDVPPAALEELAVENSLGRCELCVEETCDVGHVEAVLGSGPFVKPLEPIMLNPP